MKGEKLLQGLLSVLFLDDIWIFAVAKCTQMASSYTKVVKKKKKKEWERETWLPVILSV